MKANFKYKKRPYKLTGDGQGWNSGKGEIKQTIEIKFKGNVI